MLDNPQALAPSLESVMEKAGNGDLEPLPWQGFTLDRAADAFRFMEQARHIGKVVVTQQCRSLPAQAGFREDATYLIIGGLGGLGLRVAQWAVERGARRVVLSGRSQPATEALDTIAALEAQGATVLVEQADVSSESDMRRLLDDLSSGATPLRGVLHAAGVLDDGLLVQQDWSRFAGVLAPKVEGAWLAHLLTRDRDLDFFVLFSSIASVLGGSGAGNHSAANAFLDALAHARNQSALPGLSINWGAWSEIGAAVRDGARAHVADQGLGFIAPEQGLEVLQQAMRGDSPQVAVIAMDWPLYFERNPEQRQRPLLARIAADAAREFSALPAADAAPEPGPPDLVDRLAAAYPNQRRAMIEDHVTGSAAEILGLRPSAIDPQLPLSEMGMDSLMAVELRNALRQSIGRQFPATLMFDYPTVAALTAYLASDVLKFDESPAQVSGSEDESDLLGSIESLSDEEVEAAFGKHMERT
jgi:polyketide synthase 12/myxalamid-type polyketide synthase MxaB